MFNVDQLIRSNHSCQLKAFEFADGTFIICKNIEVSLILTCILGLFVTNSEMDDFDLIDYSLQNKVK